MEVKYIRVSSEDQNTTRQGEGEYIDRISGSVPLSDRPQGARLLRDIEAGKVTAVRVHSIDRLGRNTLDILQTVENLTAKGVNVISEKEGLHTLIDGKPNPTAKMLLGILSTLAEFERELIRERQREGIAKAKQAGRYSTNGGRNPESLEEFLQKEKNKVCLLELKRGESVRRAAKLAGVSLATAQKVRNSARETNRL